MESQRIYEDSYKSLNKLKKDLVSKDTVIINFKEMDSESAGAIKNVLLDKINSRLSTLNSIICQAK